MLSGRSDKGAPLKCNSTDRRARGRMAWGSKSKPKANADVAVEKYLEHCAAHGQRLEMLFKPKLPHYCDGHSGRPSLSALLHRPFVTFQTVRFLHASRTLVAALSYAPALHKCAQDTAHLTWYPTAVSTT